MTEIRRLFSRPKVAAELESLKRKFIEMMTSAYDEGDLGEGSEAYLSLQSLVFEAEAKYRDLHWLRRQWEAYDLAELSMAIAGELKPSEAWQILETDEVHSVVTNESRSVVFDLKLHDRLTAEESLTLAGDPAAGDRRGKRDGLNAYLNERRAANDELLRKMKGHLRPTVDDRD
jgi:hypothetical protein